MKSEKTVTDKTLKGIFTGILAVIVVIVVLNSFTTVKSGHTGVITHFGKVSNEVLTEGIHFKIPFVTKIIVMDNRTLKIEVDSSAASKDLQIVKSKVAINYNLNKDSTAPIYKTVGTAYESVVIIPALQESVKGVTAQYTAEELITRRQEISDKIKSTLTDKIRRYGINVENFNIIDFDFSAEFNKAVEAKQTAQQNALKAEQDLARIKIEAQQQVEQAKAEAESMRLKSQEVNENLVKLEAIKKWDGKLPVVSSEGGNIIDIKDILGDDSQKK